ncbi:MAG TPA: FtsQ-type POTRA domain-containing protein [Thermoanaerobaculia bacterium]|nr:FtsQ-type POTRA domain-containing protein [Thermoanaerobaculia bacterium]
MTSPERLRALAEAAARPGEAPAGGGSWDDPRAADSLYDRPAAERPRRDGVERDPRQRDGKKRRSGQGDPAQRSPAAEVPPLRPPDLFRRGPVRPRRHRGSRLIGLLRPLAAAMVLVGVPTALGAWMLTSPAFALSRLAVTGTERVPAGWVEERLSKLAGENLITLPLAEVDRALAGHPWIASVAIRKQLPDGIEVVVAERRAAALVPGPAGRRWLADGEGRPIVPATGGEDELLLVVPPPGLPGDAGADGARVPQVAQALELAAELARWKPVWAAGLDRVEALGEGDFRLHTAALPFPVTVRAGLIEPRASQLVEMLPHLATRMPAVAAVDLRFEGRILLRTAAAGQAAAGGAGPAAGDDATGRFIQGTQRRAG